MKTISTPEFYGVIEEAEIKGIYCIVGSSSTDVYMKLGTTSVLLQRCSSLDEAKKVVEKVVDKIAKD